MLLHPVASLIGCEAVRLAAKQNARESTDTPDTLNRSKSQTIKKAKQTMKLSIRKDGKHWISELTVQGTTVRTIHSPPSIFKRKKDAEAFNSFVTDTVGTKQGTDISGDEQRKILEHLRTYDLPYNMA
jgi:hypothetical protein